MRRLVLLTVCGLIGCEMPMTPVVNLVRTERSLSPDSVSADWCHVVDWCNRYPIHLYYTDDVPKWMRVVIDEASYQWSLPLAPTPTAPFVVGQTGSVGGHDFTAGDTLAPGIHVHVSGDGATRCGTGPIACAGPAWSHTWGQSDAGTEAMGFIWINMDWFNEHRAHGNRYPLAETIASEMAIHELGHVFGIGTSERWIYAHKHSVINGRRAYRLTDSLATVVFDAMSPVEFPSPRVPLHWDKSHWDSCAGHHDIMNASGEPAAVTPLTLASLSKGFVVSWSAPMIRPRLHPGDRTGKLAADRLETLGVLDTLVWNSWRCSDGVYDPTAGIAADGHGHHHPDDVREVVFVRR